MNRIINNDFFGEMCYKLIVCLFLALTPFVHPIFENKYADQFLTVKIAMLISFSILFVIMLNAKLNQFLRTEYIFYKTIGTTPMRIIRLFFYKDKILFLLVFCITYFIVYEQNILYSCLIAIQILMLYILLATLLYMGKHVNSIRKGSLFIVCFLGLLESIKIIFDIFSLLTQKMNFVQILAEVCQYKEIKFLYSLLAVTNAKKFVLIFIVTILSYKMLSLSENIVAEPSKKQQKSKKPEVFHNKKEEKTDTFIFYIKTEIHTTFRKISNVISYFFVYAVFLYAVCLIKTSSSAFFIVSVFAIILVNYGIECVYHEDTRCRQWYQVLGETYHDFLLKKMLATIILNFFIFIVNIGKTLIVTNFWYVEIALIFFTFFSIIYWNLYYTFFYWKLDTYSSGRDALKAFGALILMLIPGVNIIMCIFYYRKGKEYWDEYIGVA